MKTVERVDGSGAAYRIHNDWRVLLLLFGLAGIVESQSFGHFGAFTPLYLRELHISAQQIPMWTGILSSLGFVIGLPLLPFWGVWADRYSRKIIIVRSAYIEGLLFLVAAISPNVWVLALARFLVGFIFGNTGVMFAMLADTVPAKRLGLAIGIVSSSGPIGIAVGPFLGGLIAQGLGIRALFAFDAIMSVSAGLLLTLFVHEEQRVRITGGTAWGQLGIALRAIIGSPPRQARLCAGLLRCLRHLVGQSLPTTLDPTALPWKFY
jgi:MFS transporter, DHA1 family, multidrug resistance protein